MSTAGGSAVAASAGAVVSRSRLTGSCPSTPGLPLQDVQEASGSRYPDETGLTLRDSAKRDSVCDRHREPRRPGVGAERGCTWRGLSKRFGIRHALVGQMYFGRP